MRCMRAILAQKRIKCLKAIGAVTSVSMSISKSMRILSTVSIKEASNVRPRKISWSQEIIKSLSLRRIQEVRQAISNHSFAFLVDKALRMRLTCSYLALDRDSITSRLSNRSLKIRTIPMSAVISIYRRPVIEGILQRIRQVSLERHISVWPPILKTQTTKLSTWMIIVGLGSCITLRRKIVTNSI